MAPVEKQRERNKEGTDERKKEKGKGRKAGEKLFDRSTKSRNLCVQYPAERKRKKSRREEPGAAAKTPAVF